MSQPILTQAGNSKLKLQAMEQALGKAYYVNQPAIVRCPDALPQFTYPEQPVGGKIGLRLALARMSELIHLNPGSSYYYAVESYITAELKPHIDPTARLESEILFLEDHAYSKPGNPLWVQWAKQYDWYDYALVLIADQYGNMAQRISEGCKFPTDAVIQAQSQGFMDYTVGSVLAYERGFDPKDPHASLPCGFTGCPDACFSRRAYIAGTINAMIEDHDWIFG